MNANNYSAATSSALLSCIIDGLGGKENKFDPSKFLPCPDDLGGKSEEEEKELELNHDVVRVILSAAESRQMPPWVYSLLSSNISRWREQIA